MILFFALIALAFDLRNVNTKCFCDLQDPVKVRFNFLCSIEFRVHGQSFLVGLRLADPAFMRQQLVLVETQELIHAGGHIGHAHLHPVLDDVFDVVEEAGDGALQALDLGFSQVVFGDGHI